MFKGFYITTKKSYGERTDPYGWEGSVDEGTPLALIYFDQHGMEFTDGKNNFRLERPCSVVPACSCQFCGMIIKTSDIKEHISLNENCRRIREMVKD